MFRIGSLDDTCEAFGRVMSLAVDGDGLIYVADSQASDIRVFSPRGECVRTIGRSGEGPGEFSLLAGIAWQPPGFLWAIDSVRERLHRLRLPGNRPGDTSLTAGSGGQPSVAYVGR